MNWNPVRHGKIYCSPSCGHGCTFAQYQRVKKTAEKLANRLGEGWTIRVHENLGWFGSVVSKCGRIKVHLPYRFFIDGKLDDYSALVSKKGEIGGIHWAHNKQPEIAILRALDSAKKAADEASALVRGLL